MRRGRLGAPARACRGAWRGAPPGRRASGRGGGGGWGRGGAGPPGRGRSTARARPGRSAAGRVPLQARGSRRRICLRDASCIELGGCVSAARGLVSGHAPGGAGRRGGCEGRGAARRAHARMRRRGPQARAWRARGNLRVSQGGLDAASMAGDVPRGALRRPGEAREVVRGRGGGRGRVRVWAGHAASGRRARRASGGRVRARKAAKGEEGRGEGGEGRGEGRGGGGWEPGFFSFCPLRSPRGGRCRRGLLACGVVWVDRLVAWLTLFSFRSLFRLAVVDAELCASFAFFSPPSPPVARRGRRGEARSEQPSSVFSFRVSASAPVSALPFPPPSVVGVSAAVEFSLCT